LLGVLGKTMAYQWALNCTIVQKKLAKACLPKKLDEDIEGHVTNSEEHP
jgi:hypothetical protein